MNVIANSASSAGEAPEPAPTGELVVQNGRMKGARRPLVNPLTLIGQAPACEVRLSVEGVRPLHCAIIHGLDGYVVRDLSGDRAAQVNGERVSLQKLKDGDLLTVGPFQFLVAIPEQMRPENTRRIAANLMAERDALRIQAAAVAAQQAGLTEEEIRLEQRRSALQRQEEQLSARLDERQRQLREQDEQLKREQAAFQEEMKAEIHHQAVAREELFKARSEQDKTAHETADQRRRLVELRKRLRRRAQQHWSVQKADMARRDKALSANHAQLVKERANLDRDKQQMTEARLRLNGEMELGRRQLQDEWQQLGVAQQQWEATLNEEQADRKRRLRELEKREKAMALAESELKKERLFWNQHRTVLEQDVNGLENRVRNQRQKLLELEARLTHQGPTPPAVAPAAPEAAAESEAPIPAISEGEALPPESSRIELSEGIRRVAGLVADQRWHLLEQWERLLQVQDDWQKEHTAVLSEIDEASQRLQQREVRLDERVEQIQKRETMLEARLAQLQQRQESLSQLRCSLEGWQARLQMQTTAWNAEREEVLSSVRAREEAVAAQAFRIEELHRKRTERIQKHFQSLRPARDRCEDVRKQYVGLWKACQEQHQALVAEQQLAARQTLTLERFRMECLAEAGNEVKAEKRLERLQHNCDALNAEAQRHLERERQSLLKEMGRLDGRASTLADMEKDLVRRTDLLATQLTDLENQQVTMTENAGRRDQAMATLQVRYQLAEQQVQNLRDEVERLAQMLLEEVDAGLLPASSQAA
jgi:pSer/pThr/pTyr-binding forkhead associated (FHA) protein